MHVYVDARHEQPRGCDITDSPADERDERAWIGAILSHVRLWTVQLAVPPDTRRELARFLSSEERSRAAAFRFDRDRRRFEVARASLRLLLGRDIEVDPADVRIAAAPGRKPTLAAADAADAVLSFNVSHAHEMGLVCLSRTLEVGVDVERLRDVPDAVAISERYLSPAEARFVIGGDEAGRAARFLTCWTRTEAVTKGVGEGLLMALDSFTVPVESAIGTVGFRDASARRRGHWIVGGFALDDAYLAAVAVRVARVASSVEPRIHGEETDPRLRHCESVDLASVLSGSSPQRPS